jgi:ABC-type branched-subunit amino acid transport system permease subunit
VLSEFIRAAGPLQSIIYGVLLTVVMLFVPGGLISLVKVFTTLFTSRAGNTQHARS